MSPNSEGWGGVVVVGGGCVCEGGGGGVRGSGWCVCEVGCELAEISEWLGFGASFTHKLSVVLTGILVRSANQFCLKVDLNQIMKTYL